MHSSKVRGQKTTQLLLIAGAALLLIYFAFTPLESKKAEAGTAGSMFGYAWSDTIGWVSFNCADPGTCATSNYRVDIDTNGNLSGYAWSENIGWISFSDTAGCPQTPCQAKIPGSGRMTGWAKALAASGGWDGWINLSGSENGVNWGVVQSGTTFSGHAWGGDVVGWLDFQYARTTSSNTCAVQVQWTCTGTDSNTITKTETTPQCETETTDITTCESPGFCSSGSSVCLYPEPRVNDVLRVEPSIVNEPRTIQVHWDVENVKTCSVTGTNGDGTGSNATGVWNEVKKGIFTSGPSGKTSSVIDARTTYTLSCVGHKPYTTVGPVTATVEIAPVFEER